VGTGLKTGPQGLVYSRDRDADDELDREIYGDLRDCRGDPRAALLTISTCSEDSNQSWYSTANWEAGIRTPITWSREPFTRFRALPSVRFFGRSSREQFRPVPSVSVRSRATCLNVSQRRDGSPVFRTVGAAIAPRGLAHLRAA
jgi:hypothetical protein